MALAGTTGRNGRGSPRGETPSADAHPISRAGQSILHMTELRYERAVDGRPRTVIAPVGRQLGWNEAKLGVSDATLPRLRSSAKPRYSAACPGSTDTSRLDHGPDAHGAGQP